MMVRSRTKELSSLPNLAELMKARLEGASVSRRPGISGILRLLSCRHTVLRVSVRLFLTLVRQLFKQPARHGLSASSLGSCARKLAFDLSGRETEGRVLDSRSRIVFALGDLWELWLGILLRISLQGTDFSVSHYSPFDPQKGISFKVGTHEISGHPDGVLEYRGKPVSLIEIKSMNSFSFGRLQKEGELRETDPYWWQVQGYMLGLNLYHTSFIVLNKDSGFLDCISIDYDPEFPVKLKRHLNRIKWIPSDSPRELPDGRVLGPEAKLSKKTGLPLKGHGSLPWQCVYCSHHSSCWGSSLLKSYVHDFRGPRTVLNLR